MRVQLEARLFHSSTGSFSADVLAPGGPDLVNVVASQDPSTATLVVVAVRLAPGIVLSSTTPLRLTVREKMRGSNAQRLMLDRRVTVGAIPRGGTTHLAFWLQDTGCRPLQLQVVLTVADLSTPVTAAATVPFACGE